MSSYQDEVDSDSDDGPEGIINRRMTFCPYLRNSFTTEELIRNCPDCSRFFMLCCLHYPDETAVGKICHHLRLVFTDGACLGNGREDATTGLGVAIGLEGESQWAIPVDAQMDQGSRRTSQRAELLAAFEGIRRISEADSPQLGCSSSSSRRRDHSDNMVPTGWVVVTDSEYVVRGMTEWLPIWKRNGWRASRGRRPSDLDLFRQIDSEINEQERIHDVNIGFWHVGRQYNELADSLAKQAARAIRSSWSRSSRVESTGVAILMDF